MRIGTPARVVSWAAAIIAAGLGVSAIIAGAGQFFSLASLDVSDLRHWRHTAALTATGAVLVGYAIANVALWRRPRSERAIVLRAVFTVAGSAVTLWMIRSTQNAPPLPECGMKWLADLAPYLFATLFGTVEFAAWAGWWFSDVRTDGRDANRTLPGDRGI